MDFRANFYSPASVPRCFCFHQKTSGLLNRRIPCGPCNVTVLLKNGAHSVWKRVENMVKHRWETWPSVSLDACCVADFLFTRKRSGVLRNYWKRVVAFSEINVDFYWGGNVITFTGAACLLSLCHFNYCYLRVALRRVTQFNIYIYIYIVPNINIGSNKRLVTGVFCIWNYYTITKAYRNVKSIFFSSQRTDDFEYFVAIESSSRKKGTSRCKKHTRVWPFYRSRVLSSSTLNFRWQPVTSKTNDRDASFDRGNEPPLGLDLQISSFRRGTPFFRLFPRFCHENDSFVSCFRPSSSWTVFQRWGVETPAVFSRCFFIEILGRRQGGGRSSSVERDQEVCTIRNSSRAIDTSDPVCRPVFRLFAPLLSRPLRAFPSSKRFVDRGKCDTLSLSLSPSLSRVD